MLMGDKMDKNILLIINQFIEKMGYLQNEHVLMYIFLWKFSNWL